MKKKEVLIQLKQMLQMMCVICNVGLCYIHKYV